MTKKTNFPDLERLPPHNHFKHFLDWLWNKPRWILENFFKENFLDKNIELEVLKMNLEIKEIELTLLKNEINTLKKK